MILLVLKKKWLAPCLFVALLPGAAGAWLWLRGPEDSDPDNPYHLIEEALYLGASVPNPPRGTTAVVNLCSVQDAYSVDARFWEPILEGNFPRPDLAWLKRAVDFIATQRRAGRTTYVHCLAGVNRSAMLVTAFLMSEHGWTRDQALAHVQGRRPQARPEPGLM